MSFVFGPVPSRRLGVSLGVDIVPRKYCTLDCIYCEVCKTDKLTVSRQDFYDTNEIIEDVKKIYSKIKENIDVVTITGSGEPTLNKSFDVIVKKLKTFVYHPIALLTNSTLFYDNKVRQQAMVFDIIVPSLDAADTKTFQMINKPAKEINFHNMINGLVDFSKSYRGKLFVEVLLIKGVNDSLSHLTKLADIISSLKYDVIQLNTAFRPTAYKNVQRLSDAELLDVAFFFQKRGLKVEPVKNFISKNIQDSDKEELFEKMLHMRPLSETDIVELFGESFLKKVQDDNKFQFFTYQQETFFKKF